MYYPPIIGPKIPPHRPILHPKRLNNQSNQRSIIHQQVKSKRPKKPPQQSAQKTEATKFNTSMYQLGDLGGNRHGHNTNINNFLPLFESDNKEGINPRKKLKKNLVIVLSEYED